MQACGDCHASNFGGSASPERRFLFDINDFDETLPAPWEWDLKRLAASIVLASRELGLRGGGCEDAVLGMARAYREHIRAYADMRALDVWYSHMDAELFIEEAETAAARKRWEQVERKARGQTAQHIFLRIAKVINGRTRIVDHPPLVCHPSESDVIQTHVVQMFQQYRETLPAERSIPRLIVTNLNYQPTTPWWAYSISVVVGDWLGRIEPPSAPRPFHRAIVSIIA